MNTTELNTETFKAVQELATLTMNISEARATLEKLKASAPEYFAEREREANELVAGVIAASKEALEEADINHEALLDLGRKTRDLLTAAVECSDLIHTFSAEFTEYMNLENDKLTVKKALVETMIADMKKERVRIDADRDGIENERRDIAAIKIKIASDRAAVQSAWSALDNKKQNND